MPRPHSLNALLAEVRTCTLHPARSASAARAAATLTQAVAGWRRNWPRVVPMPHPSPRNTLGLQRNPWFEAELLPMLEVRVSQALAS